MTHVLGIDLGGTHARAGLVSAEGKVLDSRKIVVGKDRAPADVLRLLGELAGQFPKESFNAVGLGLPGIVSKEGIVHSSPHYPEWKDFPVKKELEKKLKLPVAVDNDAHMIALGEMAEGAAKGWDSFLLLTLGTGIGGAIVIEGKVFHGTRGFAGEFGHIVVESEGPACPCGGRGCLETFASASGIARIVRAAFESEEDSLELKPLIPLLTGDESKLVSGLAAQAASGSQLARDVFLRFGYYLGIGIASLVNATGIQNVLLGGGIVASQNLFLDECRRELARRTYKKTAEGLDIRLAQLGDDAGLIGSARSLRFRPS